MIVLTPTEATTLRAVLERVAAEGEVEACPDCARIRARIRGLGHIIDGRGDEDGD